MTNLEKQKKIQQQTKHSGLWVLLCNKIENNPDLFLWNRAFSFFRTYIRFEQSAKTELNTDFQISRPVAFLVLIINDE